MRILVTGGAGYIGSVVTEELINAGHQAVVYDNLSYGHREAVHPSAAFVKGDLLDTETLQGVLREHAIEAVMHTAAFALVGESVTHPAKYYQNNLVGGLSLLNAMRECGVKRLVFSSTCATYGEPAKVPIDESLPNNPTNPYGESKLAFERALKWFEGAYGLRYASLRYFNAAGATERCGEMHDPETHLIPLVLQTAAGVREEVQIFGDDYPTRDGTCVRDYIHIVDLARAHILALGILDERSAWLHGARSDRHGARDHRSGNQDPHSASSSRRSCSADCQFREDKTRAGLGTKASGSASHHSIRVELVAEESARIRGMICSSRPQSYNSYGHHLPLAGHRV